MSFNEVKCVLVRLCPLPHSIQSTYTINSKCLNIIKPHCDLGVLFSSIILCHETITTSVYQLERIGYLAYTYFQLELPNDCKTLSLLVFSQISSVFARKFWSFIKGMYCHLKGFRHVQLNALLMTSI